MLHSNIPTNAHARADTGPMEAVAKVNLMRQLELATAHNLLKILRRRSELD